MHTGKSTTGRNDMSAPRASDASSGSAPRSLRWGLRALGTVSPTLAVHAVVRMWLTPPRRRLSEEERSLLSRAERREIDVRGRRAMTWSFGEGPPVLLVHGWGGHGAQLGVVATAIAARGHRVTVFDSLGHGQSGPGRLGGGLTSFVEAADCIEAIARGREPLHAIVAHSGGAVATTIAWGRGVRADRVALIAPMARPLRYADDLDRALDLPPRVRGAWREAAAARAGFAWAEVDVPGLAARSGPPRALIVHDVDDKEVSVVEGRAVSEAWMAPLVETHGLGHQRILRDAAVATRVAEFVGEGS